MTQVLQPTAKVVSASTRPQQMLHAVLSIDNGIPQLREDSSAMMHTLARTACSGIGSGAQSTPCCNLCPWPYFNFLPAGQPT